MNGLQVMTTDSKQVLNWTVNGEKTLSLHYRFEPSHLAFFLRRWLMRGFSPVVLVLTGAMHNGFGTRLPRWAQREPARNLDTFSRLGGDTSASP